ncbi:nucleotidyl transferase AbiEii/AbiGii toxin family protein [Candidatus Desantisbacteria bacterium]|nr:nucleotidyl transferase AbiEii/AbiGii toxin family protein [Candidatus Desantisbacteria bacterium]
MSQKKYACLSRGYYNHRYSDDLDYFINDYADFERISERQIEKLKNIFQNTKIALKDKNFYRIFIGDENLKIEMINDVPSHIGQFITHSLIGLIDSKENIIANKLTAAVDRSMSKDIVDIYFLLKDGLSLKRALLDADSKAAGISPLLIAKIFAEFQYKNIDNEIKWIIPVSSQIIKKYMIDVSLAIIEGRI